MVKHPQTAATATWRLEPVGDRCLLVVLGPTIEAETTARVLALAAYLQDHPLPGVTDVAPAFTTVALHYDPLAYADARPTPYHGIAARVQAALRTGVPPFEQGAREVRIPVCYGGEYGPDLAEVAARCGLSTEEVVRLHSSSASVVYTFYFAPGNPFAGGLDERLRVPRRATPRTRVPAGSVAIANGLTTIYEVAMPGGWSLIGRTPMSMFDLRRDPPVRLRLGDRLRFVPVPPEEFEILRDKEFA
jgi:inhibitor of KinA